MEESDGDARVRLIEQATRQAYVAQLARVRSHMIVGGLQVAGGLALFVACVYVAMRVGEVTLALGGLGFLLVVMGATQMVRALTGGVSARRRLREHDARALPAARVHKA